MKQKTGCIILGAILTTACNFNNNKGLKVTIDNQSDFEIRNIVVTTSEHQSKVDLPKIGVHQKYEAFLSMKKHSMDGHYLLEFTKDDSIKETKSFGYYTNGAPLDKEINITIKNDTVIIE
ncbi:hypothetical protein [Riemerella columbina]|uniref:hypothetical protein n=1 Tax=Riemerella columbina TaxID=103810 RepID=UPI0003679360|nr:hypothetical protein [Riemerella columbina]